MDTYIAHPYVLHNDFVGRRNELGILNDWYSNPSRPILLVDAIGGAGKSALAWVWTNIAVLNRQPDARVQSDLPHVNPPEGVFWWSFYATNAKFRDFLDAFRMYALPPALQSLEGTELIRVLVQVLCDHQCLIILDGLERILAAYDRPEAVHELDRPDVGDEDSSGGLGYAVFTDSLAQRLLQGLAASGGRSRVLATSRILPSAFRRNSTNTELLAGIQRLELRGLDEVACREFFHYGGVELHPGEVSALCKPVEFHPLYVRLIRGLLQFGVKGDAAALVKAMCIGPDQQLVARQRRLLKQSVSALGTELRMVLSIVSVFRLAIDIPTVSTLAEARMKGSDRWIATGIGKLDQRGLLYFDATARTVDLHPIVRGFLYGELAAGDRMALHDLAASAIREEHSSVASSQEVNLAPSETGVDHFAGVLNRVEEDPALSVQVHIVTELFYQLLSAGHYAEAVHVYRERLMKLMFFRLAAYQESIALLDRLVPDVDSEWKISRPEDQIWILNALAMSCSRMAILSRAHELYDRAIRLAEHHGFRRPLAILLQNLSEDLQCCGDLCGSEKLILRSRDLAIETFDEAILALSFRLRGYILYLIGDIQAESELKSAADLFEKLGFVHPQLYVYTNMAWGSLLLLRPATARLNLTQAEAISQTFQYPREHCTDSLPEG